MSETKTRTRTRTPAPRASLKHLEVEQLRPALSQDSGEPLNPRTRDFTTEADWADFLASVEKHGVFQSVLVRPLAEPDGEVTHEVIAGERRLTAAGLAKDKRPVPVVVRDIGDREAMELLMAENLDRDNLDAFEEADGFARLQAMGMRLREIAERYPRSFGTVQSRLQLCRLGGEFRSAARQMELPLGLVQQVARLPDALRQLAEAELAELDAADGQRALNRKYLPQLRAREWMEKVPEGTTTIPDAEAAALFDLAGRLRPDCGFVDLDSLVDSAELLPAVEPLTWRELLRGCGGFVRCVSPKLERFELLAHSAAVAFHDANQLGLLRARPTSVVQTEIEAKQLAAAMREQYDAALFRSMREEIARGRLAPWAVLGGVLASGGAALRYALEFHARRAGAAEVHLADVEELFGQAGAALGASDDLGRAVGLLELILLTVAARGAGVGDAPYFEPVAAMLGLDVEAIKEDADARVRTAARKGSEQ